MIVYYNKLCLKLSTINGDRGAIGKDRCSEKRKLLSVYSWCPPKKKNYVKHWSSVIIIYLVCEKNKWLYRENISLYFISWI